MLKIYTFPPANASVDWTMPALSTCIQTTWGIDPPFNSLWFQTIGKVSRVLKIDSDGDVLVSFGRHVFLFAPASCIPAPDLKPDALTIESGGKLPQTVQQATLTDRKKNYSSEASSEISKSKFQEKLFVRLHSMGQRIIYKILTVMKGRKDWDCFGSQGVCCSVKLEELVDDRGTNQSTQQTN